MWTYKTPEMSNSYWLADRECANRYSLIKIKHESHEENEAALDWKLIAWAKMSCNNLEICKEYSCDHQQSTHFPHTDLLFHTCSGNNNFLVSGGLSSWGEFQKERGTWNELQLLPLPLILGLPLVLILSFIICPKFFSPLAFTFSELGSLSGGVTSPSYLKHLNWTWLIIMPVSMQGGYICVCLQLFLGTGGPGDTQGITWNFSLPLLCQSSPTSSCWEG